MSEEWDDTCSACGTGYNFEKGKDEVVIYQLSPYASHVEAICPDCNTVTRIFCTPDGLRQILMDRKITLQLGKYAPEHILESSNRVWHGTNLEPIIGLGEPVDAPEPIVADSDVQLPFPDAEAPHWMLRELYDQLREFEGEN